jgi:small subunit ribosomal protein S7
MPRRGVVPRREILPDPVYQSTLITKFVNVLMYGGKRNTADRILYGALDIIRDRTKDDPLKTFKKAIDNVRPALEVKARRVGGSTYQIPVEVNPNRRLSLAMRWLKLYASQRGGKSMREKLAAEILDASNNTGGAIKKREDTIKMAEANKAFAHYRW